MVIKVGQPKYVLTLTAYSKARCTSASISATSTWTFFPEKYWELMKSIGHLSSKFWLFENNKYFIHYLRCITCAIFRSSTDVTRIIRKSYNLKYWYYKENDFYKYWLEYTIIWIEPTNFWNSVVFFSFVSKTPIKLKCQNKQYKTEYLKKNY